MRLLAWTSPFDDPVFNEIAWYYRLMSKVMSAVPALRHMAQYHRYAF